VRIVERVCDGAERGRKRHDEEREVHQREAADDLGPRLGEARAELLSTDEIGGRIERCAREQKVEEDVDAVLENQAIEKSAEPRKREALLALIDEGLIE
jgi:hypothetical protein